MVLMPPEGIDDFLQALELREWSRLDVGMRAGLQGDRNARNFAQQCVRGLEATERGPELVERGLAIVTRLVPRIGYDLAAEIAKEAAKTGKTVREVAASRAGLSAKELDEILDPFKMTEPAAD